MSHEDEIAGELWQAAFGLDRPLVPRGSTSVTPLQHAAKEATLRFDRLREELSEARAENIALTREPTETAEALAQLREHVTAACELLFRGKHSDGSGRGFDPRAHCEGMSADGLGRYLLVLAPSQILVEGYESLWREIAELRARLADAEQGNRQDVHDPRLAKLEAALRARGHTDECYSGDETDGCDCPLQVLAAEGPR